MEKTEIPKLLQKARAGNETAMTQLLELAHGSVIFQCRKIMQHPEDAADMTQEVLLQIYQNLDKLQYPEKFLSWANRIAAHMCLNQRQRHPKDLQFLEDENGHSVLDEIEDADRQHIPDAAMDNAETKRLVTDLIDALPEAQRTAIYLYYYSEMSVREIAALTGVSENTVKSRLNYGRKALKDGFLGYEKDGIKLYSLSPLPFLLLLLRGAAESQADPAAASAAAKAVLTSGAVAAAGAAGASGTTAGSAAAAETTAASAAAGTSAAAAAGAGGILGAVSAKVVAAVLAGVVAVGGITAGVVSHTGNSPEAAGTEITQTISDWTDPVPMAACTLEQRGTTSYPVFEENSEGYQIINQYFKDLVRSEPFSPEIPLNEVSAQSLNIPFSEEYQLIYQDGFFVSVHLRRCSPEYMPGQRGFTFDVRTGELLTLEDLTGGTAEEIAAMLYDAVASSEYAGYLTEDNAPSADSADWDYIIRSGVVCYLWSAEPGRSAIIPLPVELPDSGVTPLDQSQLLEIPAITYRFRSVDSGTPRVEFYTALPVFDSLKPGYQAANEYLQNEEANYSPDFSLLESIEYTTDESPLYERISASIMGQDERYLCLNINQSSDSGGNVGSHVKYVTFDLATGQEISPRDLLDLTDEEITEIALEWISSSEFAPLLEYDTFKLQDQYVYQDGKVCCIWVTYYSTPRGWSHYIPLAEPSL